MATHTGPLKGAMIGAGYFGQFHAEGWQRIPGASVEAVADPNLDRAKAFATRWGIARAYASAREMLESEKPFFVDIVTRPESHLELTRLAAQSGAHVICQKPMAPGREECVAMVEACEQAGVRLIMHENWRWQPWYREAKRLIDKNKLGTLFHLGFRMRTGDGRGGAPYTAQPYFREMPQLLVYETAVHFIDTFRFLAGDIKSVFCHNDRVNRNIKGEDYSLVILRFKSGVNGLIDANRISGPTPNSPVLGTFDLIGDMATVRVSHDGRMWMRQGGGDEKPHEFEATDEGYKGDSVRAMSEHALMSLRHDRPSESDGRPYLGNIDAVEACYRSAREGQRILLK